MKDNKTFKHTINYLATQTITNQLEYHYLLD